MNETPIAVSYRLSPIQRQLLASARRGGDAPVQNMVHLVRFGQQLDAERFVKAFDGVVRAADVLRTRIAPGDERAELWAEPPVVTDVVPMARDQVAAWAAHRGSVAFDLSQAAYDSVLITHDDDGPPTWYLAFDHLVTDATTTARIVDATGAAYDNDPTSLIDPLPSYYAFTRGATTEGSEPPAAASGGRLGRLYLPHRGDSATSERSSLVLDDELASMIDQAIAERYRVFGPELSWTILLVAATSLWLHQLTHETEISIGLPVHNRTTTEAEAIVGPLVELHPVRITVDPSASATTFHKMVSRAVLGALRESQSGKAPTDDFDVVVNVIPHSGNATLGGLPVNIDWVPPTAIDPGHVLRVQLTGYDADQRSIDLDINTTAAHIDHRRRAPGHLRAALGALIERPERPIGEASLVAADSEEAATINAWESGPGASLITTSPITASPIEALRDQLRGNDDVVVFDSAGSHGDVTGDQLWAWSCAVAEHLRSRGVHAGDRVSVELDPGVDALAAIYGVMIAGCSFVPMDPTQPDARRARLAARANCQLRLDAVDVIAALRTDQAVAVDPHIPAADNEAYLLFTSGSTGEPKGVPITQRGLTGYLNFALSSYFESATASKDRPIAPLFSSLGFDLTITTLFGPILAGGAVVTTPSGAAALAAIASDARINWIKATPSHLDVLMRLSGATSIDTAIVGGEAFATSLARQMKTANPAMRIFNEYGPTEAVVGCMIHELTSHEIDESADVPIGRPAPGVRLRIASTGGAPVPIGAVGELLISHDGVTTGYLASTTDDGAESDDKFIELDGRRWYRSGDLVRLRDDERCDYLGRVDTQLKVGGRRLDPVEVEAALRDHPAVNTSAVRLWSPQRKPIQHRCSTCGLADNVPGIDFDEDGVCATCRAYERVAPAAAAYFHTTDDLVAKRDQARGRRTGDYDCLHLLSGGKDSTYALYRLVELGFTPFVLTLDNGFISEGAKDNIRQTVADLQLDHEFATTPAMNEIFRDSLATFSNVCNGCYKTIYTLATQKADQLGIPLIVTGLSRGQLFETRLLPAQFAGDVDPDEIDRAVLRARMHYHRMPDVPNRLLDTEIFATDDIFERIEYLDFYRYIDVELAEMLDYLAQRSPWVRPSDTGRSTNCLINIAGIHTHQLEEGYHNYAVPYAWDVRLGHKTRDESIDELDDEPETDKVIELLADVAYEPSPRRTLTAWITPKPERELPTSTELRAFLADRLPVWSIPAAFVEVDELPVTTNGKLDDDRLPPPDRVHRPGVETLLEPTTELEQTIVAVWERTLGIEPIGRNDDFFALGGDSLRALGAITELSAIIGRSVPDEMGFVHTTPETLAAAIDDLGESRPEPRATSPLVARATGAIPAMSPGEASILFEQRARPDAVMYNLARNYRVDAALDARAFAASLASVVESVSTLAWTYSSPRRLIPPNDRFEFIDRADAQLEVEHRRPFDLTTGPFLRCLFQPVDDQTTDITFVVHHATGDRTSLDILFDRVQAGLGRNLDVEPAADPVADTMPDYADLWTWHDNHAAEDRAFWFEEGSRAAISAANPPVPAFSGADNADGLLDSADGLLTRTASVGSAEIVHARGSSAVALVVAAAAEATAPAYADKRVQLCLLSSARVRPESCDMVGYFLNPLPIDLDLNPSDQSSEGRARLVRDASRELGRKLPHRAYPFASIVADRTRAGLPVPQPRVLVAWDEGSDLTCDGAPTIARAVFNGTAVADVTLFAEVRGAELALSIEFDGQVVGSDEATRILDRFDHALTESLAVQSLIATLPSPDDDALLVGPELDDERSVVGHILDRLCDPSDDPAVTVGDANLTWRELAVRVASLAAELRDRGVAAGAQVAIELERSCDLVAAILAVLARGASYVPIDPTYPVDRRQAIIDASTPVCTIGRSTNHLDPDSVAAVATPLANLIVPSDEGSAAYVIFTSGSTGQPRGVVVNRRQLTASTRARHRVYDASPSSFLVVSSAAFDSSIVGLFWTLVEGGHVVLPTDDEVHDVDRLAALIHSAAVTHTLLVPSLYAALLRRRTARQQWPGHVIVAGEACPIDLVRDHFTATPNSRLTNEYGPTEATVWATAHHCDGNESETPIGPPIPGTWVATIDDSGQLCRTGEAGELVIGGAGVTTGYLNEPEATASRFRHDLAGLPSGPAFLTGDRAIINDGTVRFLGRLDDQINLGGLRVEPAEIEATLTSFPGVRAAVAGPVDLRPLDALLAAADPDVARSAMERASASPDPAATLLAELRETGLPELRLAAWIEASDDVDPSALRAHVTAGLAPMMRPERWTIVERLPRSANGKIDRAAAMSLDVESLPAPAGTSLDQSVGSNGELVESLRRAFATTLSVADIGPNESFFDQGGNSLLVLQLLDAIETQTGQQLSTTEVFSHPTPAGLATALGAPTRMTNETIGTIEQLVIPVHDRGSRPPMFAINNLGNNCEYFRPLSAYLGDDQPVYGLGAMHRLERFGVVDYDPDRPMTVEEIAASCVASIERIAPEGPVVLTGLCGGAIHAYEVAQQLTARGRDVAAFIIVNDWLAPYLGADDKTWQENLGRRWNNLVTLRREYLAILFGPLKRIIENVELKVMRRLGRPLTHRQRVREYIEVSLASMYEYEYLPYDGPTTVIRGRNDPRLAGLDGVGWGDLFSDVTFEAVDGIGVAIMEEPDVAATAEVYRQVLDRLQDLP